MWTDFNGGNEQAMKIAEYRVSDFKLIKNPDSSSFKSADTLELHSRYVKELLKWFDADLTGPRVVVSAIMHPRLTLIHN